MLLALLTTVLLHTGSPVPFQEPGSAQQPPPSPAADSSAPTKPATQTSGKDSGAKKEKRVWTNENLSDAKGSVSVVGGNDEGRSNGPAGKAPDAPYVAGVKKKLEKLRDDLAAADQQIAKLRQFTRGDAVGTNGLQRHKGYNTKPVSQQIQDLEAKKKDLEAQIDALLDEARKRGVEPGQLR